MRLQSKLNLSIKFSGATFPEKIARINHKLMPPEVDYILKHSESKIFLFDDSLAEVAAKLSTKVRMICMDSPAEGFEQFELLLDTAPAFSPDEGLL